MRSLIRSQAILSLIASLAILTTSGITRAAEYTAVSARPKAQPSIAAESTDRGTYSASAATNATGSSTPEATATDPDAPLAGADDGGQAGGFTAEPVSEADFVDRTNGLAEDIAHNPLYSEATKDLLLEQLANDYSDFDLVAEAAATSKELSRIGRGRVAAQALSKPLRLSAVRLQDPYTRHEVIQDCGPYAPCSLPLDYNVEVPVVTLEWSFDDSAIATDFYTLMTTPGDRRVAVALNGILLPEATSPLDGEEGFAAADYRIFFRHTGCGSNANFGVCLALEFPSDAWFQQAPPWSNWTVEIQVWGEEALDHVQIEFDRFGQPFAVHSEWVQQSSASGVIAPRAVLKDFFTATIGASVQSDRCTSCHSMTTRDAIVEHHSGLPVSQGDIVLVPSIVDPGASIFSCASCHQGLVDAQLPGAFDETRWATPPASMDIDWGRIIEDHASDWPIEICNRIVSNLPTASAREHHFHEDARLFWAVADARDPIYLQDLGKAQPQSYGLFLQHFDAWNDSGARCPQSPQ